MKINESWPVSINSGLISRDISIYPNPFEDYILLKDEYNQVERVKIFTLTGRELADFPYRGTNIQLTTLNPGFYIVKVFTGSSHVYTYHMMKRN